MQAALGRPEAADTARQALETLVATLGADHPVTRNAAPILQRIASGNLTSPSDPIQALADQARDAAIAALNGQTNREKLIARVEEVERQAAEGKEPGSPWDQLASYLRAVVALLRGEPGLEVPAAFAEHYAAIEGAARGAGVDVSPEGV